MTWQRYILAFVVTVAIFGTAFYIANRLDAQRIADVRATEEDISLGILNNETQYELLGNLDCQTIAENPGLTDELNNLASQLSVAESNLGSDNPEVIQLKKQYSLLEIKDYILLEQLSAKCGFKSVSILYFYSNTPGDCPECSQAGDVLTYLRQTYPGLRVYSFDYTLDLSALKTLTSLRHVDPEHNGGLPAFVINNRAPVYGFKDLPAMEQLIPELKTLATSTASTTNSK